MPQFDIYRSTDNVTFTKIGETVFYNYNDITAVPGQKYYYKTLHGAKETPVIVSGIVPAYQMKINKSISIPQSAANNFVMSANWSVEMWVRTNLIQSNDLFSRIEGDYKFYLNRTAAGLLRFNAVKTVTTNEMRRATATLNTVSANLSLKTPYHIVVTCTGKDRAGLKMYVNGIEVTAYTTNEPNNLISDLVFNNAPWIIGGTAGSNDVQIGLFRMFNAELTAANVTTLYNGGFPLYDASAIGNIVGEYKILNDTVNAGIYTLIDSSGNNNNGVTVATDGTEMGVIKDFRAADWLPIKYRGDATNGWDISMNDLCEEGCHIGAGANYSPFMEVKAFPESLLNIGDYTYIGVGIGGKYGYSSEGMILRYNHVDKVLDKRVFLGVQRNGLMDGHEKLSLIQKQGTNNIIICQENYHGGTAISVYLLDTTTFTVSQISSIAIATYFGYPQFAYLGTRLYVFIRGWVNMKATAYYYSDDGGVNWTQGYKVTDGIVTRSLHSVMKFDTTKLRLYIFSIKEDTDSIYIMKDMNYLESTDGITWRNIDNSYSKDIVNVGAITQAQLVNYQVAANFTVDQGWQLWSWDFDTNGNPVFLSYNNVTAKYEFYFWSGAAWTFTELTSITPSTEQFDMGIISSLAVVVARGGTVYDLFVNQTISDFEGLCKYSTVDNFVTITGPIRLSKGGRSLFYPHRTFNVTKMDGGGNMLIAANSLDYTGTKQKAQLFLFDYTI